jgi:hypothetical protein
LLLENEGIGDELLPVFVVYLISGNRPLAEMIAPQFQPLEAVFNTQFKGMTKQPISVAELEDARHTLVDLIQERLAKLAKNFYPTCPACPVPPADVSGDSKNVIMGNKNVG